MIDFHTKHPIVFLDYIVRVCGNALSIPIIISALLAQNHLSLPSIAMIIFICLTWPNIALYFAYNSRYPKQLEIKFIFIDCFIYGAFAALAGYSIWLVVCFSFCLLNSALSLNGISEAIKGMISMLVGMLIPPLIFGPYFNFYTDIRTTVIILVTMYIYISVTGYLTYARNKAGKKIRARLNDTLAELDQMNKVLQECNASLKVHHVINILTDSLKNNIFSFDTLTFQSYDPEKDELVYKTVDDPLLSAVIYDSLNNITVQLNEKAFATDVFNTGKLLYFSDVQGVNLQEIDQQIQRLLMYQSAIVFPLIIKNKCIGIIAFYSRTAMILDQHQIDKIQNYINQVTLIINNAILYDQVRSQRVELGVKNEQMESLSQHLAKYIPPQLFEKIIGGKADANIGAQKKLLTVFFSDLGNFGTLSDQLDSEKLTQMLNIYLDSMTNIALRYGGTIDKYIGDAVMIFFGDPGTKGAREDALQCALMALDMMNNVRELRTKWQEIGIPKELQIRIGIHTGYCAVGNYGSDFRMDYTIIGSAVNLSSRLMSSSKPGDIIISEQTWKLIKDQVVSQEMGFIHAKGFTQPIKTYSVLAKNKNKALPHRDG